MANAPKPAAKRSTRKMGPRPDTSNFIGATATPKVSENYTDPSEVRTGHEFVRPKPTARKKPSGTPEERFAKSEAAQKELDSATGTQAREPGVRYSGEGVESGRLTSTTEYPIPTTKSGGADPTPTPVGDARPGRSTRTLGRGTPTGRYVPDSDGSMVERIVPGTPVRTTEATQGVRKAINFEGSTGELAYQGERKQGSRATDQQHAAQVRRVQEAAPHRVEAEKRKLAAFESANGVPFNAPRICSGDGCKNVMAAQDEFANASDRGEIEWVKATSGPKAGTMVARARGALSAGTISAASSDPELCGGSVCKTVQAKTTPTPRPAE